MIDSTIDNDEFIDAQYLKKNKTDKNSNYIHINNLANTYFITKLFVNLHSRMVYRSISTGSKSFHRPMKWINQSPQLFCSPKINQYIAYWIFFFKPDIIQLLGHFPPPPPKKLSVVQSWAFIGKKYEIYMYM